MNDDQKITYFGETNFRNQLKRFGIKKIDRRKHMYVIGKTGMGKTTLLENLAMQDIQSGEGLAFIDPHGETAYKLLDFVPKERMNDVIYFDPADTAFPVGLNVMENVDPEKRHFVASGLMSVFKKIFGPDVWSARMEYILSNTVLALLEYPGSTLLSINPMLAVKEFRKKVVASVKDPVISAFWTQEFAKYTERFAAEATPAIQNKIGQFTSNPLIRNIIGQVNSTIDMRKIMDERKILIVNLAKGRVGEDTARLLGMMIVTKLYLAAMSRVDIIDERNRKDFFLYVDEFQNFATESFANILSEARKYRLSLTLAHQYMAQLAEEVRDAVIGNVGTMLSFRVGADDAEFLEKEFGPEFMATDMVNLGFAQIYLKLMIDGVASRPFSSMTLPPINNPGASFRAEIMEASRKNFGVGRQEIEEKIGKWMAEMGGGGEAEKRIAGRQSDSLDLATKPPSGGFVAPMTLYDAVCFVCGKQTKVPFQPDPSRPVFCKEHIGMAGRVKEIAGTQARSREERPRDDRQYDDRRQFASAHPMRPARPGEGEFVRRRQPPPPPRQDFRDSPSRHSPPASAQTASLKELERPVRDGGADRGGRPQDAQTFHQPFKRQENLQVLRDALKKSMETKKEEQAKPTEEIEEKPAPEPIIKPTETSSTLKPGQRIEL